MIHIEKDSSAPKMALQRRHNAPVGWIAVKANLASEFNEETPLSNTTREEL